MVQNGFFRYLIVIAMLSAGATGLLIACAAPTAVSPARVLWYEQSSGAYNTEAGKLFYGIGAADRLKNRSLQRVNADNRARHEMGRLLDQYSKALAVTATRAHDGSLSAMHQDQVQAGLHSLVRRALRRAIVSDHWVNPETGRMMALCTLSLEQYKTALSEDAALDPQLRSAMQSHADMLYGQLAVDFQEN